MPCCLQITKQAFQELLGKEPKVAAIHAGLECGIIGEKVPGMDAVSYGPTITGAHSPDEQVCCTNIYAYCSTHVKCSYYVTFAGNHASWSSLTLHMIQQGVVDRQVPYKTHPS